MDLFSSFLIPELAKSRFIIILSLLFPFLSQLFDVDGVPTGRFKNVTLTRLTNLTDCERQRVELEYTPHEVFAVFTIEQLCDEPFPIPIYGLVLIGVGGLVILVLVLVFAVPPIRRRFFTFRERKKFELHDAL